MGFILSLFNKKTCFIYGIIILILITFEEFIFVTQPFCATGFNFDLTNNGYLIKDISKDSPATDVDLEKGDLISYINGFSVYDLYKLKKSDTPGLYKIYTSTFFTYNSPSILTMPDGSKKFLIPQHQSFIQQFKWAPHQFKVKFSVAIISILCGLFCCFICGQNEKIRPLIFLCFNTGLAVQNCFSSDFLLLPAIKLTQILFDIGALLAVSNSFLYTDRVFSYSKKYNKIHPFFEIIDFIPVFLVLVKFSLIGIVPQWSFINNPLNNLSQIMIVAVFICSIGLVIYILVNFPRQLTITFRFFVLALIFGITPLIFIKLEDILTHAMYSCILDECLSIVPFLYLPIFITISIIQGWGKKANNFVLTFSSFVSYMMLSTVILYVLGTYIEGQYQIVYLAVFAILQPAIYLGIKNIFVRFLSADLGSTNKEIEQFEQRLTTIDTHIDLYKMTTVQIINSIDCSFVFFHIKNDSNNSWEIPYLSNSAIPRDYILELIADADKSKSKTLIQTIKDDCFVVPIFKGESLAAQIYVGHKNNMENFVPGEHSIVQQLSEIFYKYYLILDNKRNEIQLAKNTQKIIEFQETTIVGMANLIESRDGNTGEHVKQTARYVKILAEYAMQHGYYSDIIDENYIKLICKAAPLHDIGKVVVPDALLRKPGKFTPDEFEEMKRHTTEGGRVVKEVLGESADPEQLQITMDIATFHHEKWNGMGYPQKLKGEAIPLCARIMAVADVFDALVSPRCYKEPMDIDEAFGIIEKDAGTHFDPTLARLFVENKEAARVIAQRR